MPASPMIRLEGIVKRFPGVSAVNGVDLEIAGGEFFSLLGASGCGKTTLLRVIAGLDRPDRGRVLIDGNDMTDVPPWARPVNTVFQSYALFPHMSVAGNVAFGLKQERLGKREIASRVAEALTLVALQDVAARKPDALSGGQRQRVALARALVKRPRILLLDEPMAALDRRLREQTRFELTGLQRRLGITFVMVTHDQEEAMGLSDRVAVMEAGRIRQVGTPRAVYDRPADRFVASFVGDANLLDGVVEEADGGTMRIRRDCGDVIAAISDAPADRGARVSVMVRPERGRLHLAPTNGTLAARVEAVAFLGSASVVRVRLGDGTPFELRTAERPWTTGLAPGDAVWVGWDPADAVVLTG